jgi:hypothetical protein
VPSAEVLHERVPSGASGPHPTGGSWIAADSSGRPTPQATSLLGQHHRSSEHPGRLSHGGSQHLAPHLPATQPLPSGPARIGATRRRLVCGGGPSVIRVAVSVGLPPGQHQHLPWRPSPVSCVAMAGGLAIPRRHHGRPSSSCSSPPPP